MKRLTLIATLITLIVSAIGLRTPHPVVAQQFIPWFEVAPCMFDLPEGQTEGETVECGYLTVLEDRGQPDGSTIRLAVAIFKSTSDDPGPPFVRLDGGPGGHSVGMAGPFLFELASSEHLLERGDLILMDQRGVGFSEPSLACTEVNEAQLDLLDDNLSLEDEAVVAQEALQACRDRLAAQGINLSAYNSAQNAADVADLWQTLGYDEINLYGVSYGTRLALTIMRDYPDGLRSVILDSAFPPQADLYVYLGTNAQRSFRLLFDDCAADAACAEAFPKLEKNFYQTVERLNQEPEPLRLTSFETGESYDYLLTGDDFFGLVFNTLYVSQLIGFLPALIDSAANKDYTIIGIIASIFELDQSLDYGMYFSVQCFEEVPFQTEDQQSEADARLIPPIRRFVEANPLNAFQACNIWDIDTAASIEDTPVVSDIPTLIVAGEYDPITPPDYGRATAETLSNGYFFEFPGLGHGVFDEGECPLSITLAFLDEPGIAPDGSCIDDMPGPEYSLP